MYADEYADERGGTAAVRARRDRGEEGHHPCFFGLEHVRKRGRAKRRGRASSTSARSAREPTSAVDREPHERAATAERKSTKRTLALRLPAELGLDRSGSGEEARPSKRCEREDGDASDRVHERDCQTAPRRTTALARITCEIGREE